MSSIIKFTVGELRRLAASGNACVEERRVTQSLALQPWCLGNLKDSIKNLLDYKIGKYDKEYDGILLSYKNLNILQNVGAIRNDQTDIHFKVQADYFIFRPYIGAKLCGIVNKKSATHLGIVVHKVFNVVIPRPTDEPGSKWIGMRFTEGQKVYFKIVMLDLYGALPYIRGEIDESFLDETDAFLNENVDEPPEGVKVTHILVDNIKPTNKKAAPAPEENTLTTPQRETRRNQVKTPRYTNGKAKDSSPERSAWSPSSREPAINTRPPWHNGKAIESSPERNSLSPPPRETKLTPSPKETKQSPSQKETKATRLTPRYSNGKTKEFSPDEETVESKKKKLKLSESKLDKSDSGVRSKKSKQRKFEGD